MKWLTATRLLALLVGLVLIVGGANVITSRLQFDAYTASQAREHAQQLAAQRRQQAAQEAAGIQIEQKLCLDLGTMAAIKAPPGNAKANPSRGYEQSESRAWRGLYDSLECGVGVDR